MRERRERLVALLLVSLIGLAAQGVAATAGQGGSDVLVLTDVRGAEPGRAPTQVSAAAIEGAPWWQTTAMDADRDGVFDELDALVDSGSRQRVDVLVDVDARPDEAMARELSRLADATGWGLFPNLGVVGLASVPAHLIPTLAEAPGVVMVEPRVDAQPYQDVATRALKAQESIEYSPYTAWELGFSGSGVNIAIMDTGVDDAHSALVAKFVAGVDFTKPERQRLWPRDGSYNPDDQGGHGTTCAGIAMGTGQPTGEYMGAAPDAGLVDLRIGTRFGFSPGELENNFYDAALQAIDWAASHHDTVWDGGSQGIDVVSLSWGIPYDGPSDGTDAYSRGLDQNVLAGIVVCVAVGNEGPNNDGITGMSASSEGIIVGALDDLNTITRTDDELASYSTRGPRDDDGDDYLYDELKPDVTAPGTNIMGVVYEQRGDGSGGGYGNRGSGTSYATPYVAGVTALMLQANPDLDPYVIREVLRVTAERAGEPEYPDIDPYWSRLFGWGMVDAYNATKVATQIERNDHVNAELQAFVTNLTGGTPDDPMIDVVGIAWARVGEVQGLEWRVDGGPWTPVWELPGVDGDVLFTLDPSELGEGEHELHVRAVDADGDHSVWRPVTLTISGDTYDAANVSGGVGLGTGCLALFIVMVVAGVFVWRFRPGLVTGTLRRMGFER